MPVVVLMLLVSPLVPSNNCRVSSVWKSSKALTRIGKIAQVYLRCFSLQLDARRCCGWLWLLIRLCWTTFVPPLLFPRWTRKRTNCPFFLFSDNNIFLFSDNNIKMDHHSKQNVCHKITFIGLYQISNHTFEWNNIEWNNIHYLDE